MPFGAHKGYGLGLINETRPHRRLLQPSKEYKDDDEKQTTAFYFQVIHLDALVGGIFAQGRDQTANIKAVIKDILYRK